MSNTSSVNSERMEGNQTPSPPVLEPEDYNQPPAALNVNNNNQPPAALNVNNNNQPPAALNVNNDNQPPVAQDVIDNHPLVPQNVDNQNLGVGTDQGGPTIPYGAGDLPLIRPEDSASNISKRSSNRSERSTASALRLKNNQKQIELKLQLAALQETNAIEEEKRLLKMKLYRETEEVQCRAEELSRRQKEIVLRAKLQAAREVNDMIDLQDSEVTFKTKNINRSVSPVIPVPPVKPSSVVQLLVENEKSEMKENSEVKIPATFSSSTSSSDLLTIFNKLIETQKDQALPNQDIAVFDGSDILNYFTFVKNFELIIEKHTDDYSRRLEFLLKYTSGEANELIKFTPLINEPKAAYQQARELLHRDYGDPHLMAQEFMSRAESWNKVPSGDKAALRKFSIFLVNCVNSKQNNPDMTSLDGFDFIKTLCGKLPIPVQQKWKSENGRIRDSLNRSPNLIDFERFVNLISRNENDPRVSGLGYQTRPSHTQHVKHNANITPQRKAYTTQVKQESTSNMTTSAVAPCLFCGIGTKHSLLVCRKFSALSPSDKSDIVRKKGLCYGCLNPGHMRDKCPNLSKCDICPRKHPTILHDPAKDKREADTSLKTLTASCAVTNNNDPLMAILPVKVISPSTGHQINTYAFLDNGFSSVFITDELTKVLNLPSKSVKVSVKTVNSVETVKTGHITDLLVSDLKGNNPIKIDSVYVRQSMPVTLSDAPAQSDLNKWSHLKGIELPILSGVCIPSVSLMIGISVPSASTPLELATGRIGDPYAVRSPLGWLFYGLPGKLTNVEQTRVRL